MQFCDDLLLFLSTFPGAYLADSNKNIDPKFLGLMGYGSKIRGCGRSGSYEKKYPSRVLWEDEQPLTVTLVSLLNQ